jgi:hypothetical protein
VLEQKGHLREGCRACTEPVRQVYSGWADHDGHHMQQHFQAAEGEESLHSEVEEGPSLWASEVLEKDCSFGIAGAVADEKRRDQEVRWRSHYFGLQENRPSLRM